MQGVYVANPGYVFGAAAIPRGAVITSFDGKPMESLADFEAALTGSPTAIERRCAYFTLDDPRGQQWRVIRMDRRWFPARKCQRDDSPGIWPCQRPGGRPGRAST